jgi:hypothetical protein
MDVSAIYSECGRLLSDPNNDRWNQAVLLARINLAQTKVIAYTNAIKERESLTPVSGTSTVSVDADTVDIIRVDIQRDNGDWVKLRGYLRDQLDFEDPNWQQKDDGEPQAYWWDGTNQQINLVPAPDSANAISSGLRVWEVRNPTALDDSADVPFASNAAMIPYHMALVHWVVAQCLMDDGTPEALQKSKFHKSGLMARPGEFENEIKRIHAKFDSPEDIPVRLLWKPQGGRIGRTGVEKSNPLGQ